MTEIKRSHIQSLYNEEAAASVSGIGNCSIYLQKQYAIYVVYIDIITHMVYKGFKKYRTSSNERRATVSEKGVVRAKKAGTVRIRATAAYRQNGKKKTVRFSCRIKIRNYKSVKGKKIKMTTKNTEVIITLNGSKAAADLVAMLPLELRLIERNEFAKGMTLPKPLSSGRIPQGIMRLGISATGMTGRILRFFTTIFMKKRL